MDDMAIGTPWLDKPMRLHEYREYECDLNVTALCEYKEGYWRFWYEADHRYALPTIAFFTVGIILFSIAFLFDILAPESVKSASSVRRLIAVGRYFSYRAYRIRALNWNTAPLGVLLLGAVGTIYFFCMTLAPTPYYWPNTAEISFGNSPPIATRAGWLSLGCMPFVFLTAGKSNLITIATGVSHEKLQVYHRWISYAFFVTALIHTFPFIVYNISQGTMVEQWNTSVFYWTGVIALIAQTYLTFASIGPLRSMGYEWFKFSHFLAALVFMLFLFFHCDHTLTAWDYFIVTGVIFSLSWLHRQIRIYFEHGIGHRAQLNLTGNGFVCVRIPTATTWGVGQHFFVRFLSLGIHMGSIHPFTACSIPSVGSSREGKTSELVLYIRPRGGLTARLAHIAESQPDRTIRVLLDGPYGGVDSQKLVHYPRQLIIAGGSGAGWALPMIAAFLRKYQMQQAQPESERVPLQTAKIVLITRDSTTKAWFEESLEEILASFGLEQAPSALNVELHYTGTEQKVSDSDAPQIRSEKSTELGSDAEAAMVQVSARMKSDISSDLDRRSDMQHLDGRPDLRSLVHSEATLSTATQGQLGVFVCGPLSMQNDVANAVADEQLAILKGSAKQIYLHMEHYSWA